MIVNNVNSTAKYYSSVGASRYANTVTAIRGVQRSDAFTPSKEAQTFSELLKKLKDTSEVREDKVSKLQQQMDSGQYSVSADRIALSLLSSRY